MAAIKAGWRYPAETYETMLKTIQAGRGLAALSVCAFHLSIFFGDARYLGHPVLSEWTGLGRLGVDFFFVLSGFIIMHAHHGDLGRPEAERPQALKTYALKRFIRVFPVYWLYTIGYSALVLLGVGTVASIPSGFVEWLSTFSLVRMTTFFPPLHPAWTLFHEVAFYAVFAILIWNRKWGIIAFAVWGLAILGTMGVVAFAPQTPISTYLSSYNLDFVIGIAAYYLWKRGKRDEGYLALALGVTLLVLVVMIDPHGEKYVGVTTAYGLAFGAILAGAVIWETHRAKLSIPLMTLLGNASYTIYLTHEPVMGVFVKIFLWLNKRLHLPEEVIYFPVLILTIIACCVVYRFVETPLINVCKAQLMPRKDGGPKPAEAA